MEWDVVASNLARGVLRPSALIRSCNDSLERREEGSQGRIESDVRASCSASRKRGAVSGRSSISCHPSGLEGGAGVVKSTAVFGLLKRPASGAALLARRLTSSAPASASEPLESSSSSRTIGSSTPYQRKLESVPRQRVVGALTWTAA